MSSSDAAILGIKDQDRIAVAAEGDTGRILFRNVLVRVSANYRLELRLDTDEAAAAGLHSGDCVILSKVDPSQVRSDVGVVAQA